MTLPRPARKVVDLFNRVTETNLFDVAANKALDAELLKLSRRGPDLIVSTALARVALRLGCRAEAIESMERTERLTDYAFAPVMTAADDLSRHSGLSRCSGNIRLYEEPLEYQIRTRGEWRRAGSWRRLRFRAI